MATPEILLTEDQRLEFTQIPQNISEWEIAKYYTLTVNDIENVNRRRRDYNRLGFAVQLCVLRNPGWSLGNTQEIPESVLVYISEQLNINPKEFELYFQEKIQGWSIFKKYVSCMAIKHIQRTSTSI